MTLKEANQMFLASKFGSKDQKYWLSVVQKLEAADKT